MTIALHVLSIIFCKEVYSCLTSVHKITTANNRVRNKFLNQLSSAVYVLYITYVFNYIFNYIKRDYCKYFQFKSLEESKEASDLVEAVIG